MFFSIKTKIKYKNFIREKNEILMKLKTKFYNLTKITYLNLI